MKAERHLKSLPSNAVIFISRHQRHIGDGNHRIIVSISSVTFFHMNFQIIQKNKTICSFEYSLLKNEWCGSIGRTFDRIKWSRYGKTNLTIPSGPCRVIIGTPHSCKVNPKPRSPPIFSQVAWVMNICSSREIFILCSWANLCVPSPTLKMYLRRVELQIMNCVSINITKYVSKYLPRVISKKI